ncbi:MAG TPA: hypothetical protein VFU15_15385 [Bacteroidia bacterium]|nr:hypothetical protein [Bacteroidia bacterium]
MHPRLLLFLAFVFPATVSFAQSKKQIKDLKIKSVTETVTLYKDGKETSTYKASYKTFDKDGNVLSDITYNPDGSVRRQETNTYSGKNKTVEIVEKPNPGPSSDEDDTDDSPSRYKKTAWKYNANGDKTEEVVYDASGNVVKKTTYAYSTSGDKMIEVTYDGTGKMLKKIDYGYDSRGLRTEKKIYATGDVLVKSVKYTYTY